MIFLKFRSQNLWHSKDVPIKFQNNFYIVLNSYVEGHVKKNSILNFMSSVGFQASKIWMFFWKIYCEIIPTQK